MSEKQKTEVSFAAKAYAAAEKALREQHADEFDALIQAEYDRAGVKRVKRLTAEERAAKVAEEKAAKEAAKEQARREKALATAQALQAEFPDLLVVNAPSLDEEEPHLAAVPF